MKPVAHPTGSVDAGSAGARASRRYWDGIATAYQRHTVISCRDIHYGPLIPGDRALRLLPPDLAGQRCLEIGCGAGQNSICLARRGAHCTAVDVSGRMVRIGAALAVRHRVRVDFVQADMARLPFSSLAGFDLVHSAYALPFAPAPQECVRAMAAVLRPGGSLVLSTAHPLATGEWLTVDADNGVFLPDYFSPPADRRQGQSCVAVCRPVPLSTVFAWLTAAGLRVEDLREPPALPVRGLTSAQLRARVPYWSRAWLRQAAQFARVPVVAIFKATKPPTEPPRRPPKRRLAKQLPSGSA